MSDWIVTCDKCNKVLSRATNYPKPDKIGIVCRICETSVTVKDEE